MSEEKCSETRRRFLKTTALGVAAAPFASIVVHNRSALADMERLSESDEAAQAVAYVHDAADADDPAYEEGQICGNCALYSDQGDGWGGCSVFPDKLVAEEGWCNVWASAG
ncbi:hypothetical protein J2T57_002499 [Natronocella acetinitrilica]|jgi:hypothetical protein|uniref:High potential iron-sulfur proteins family profile domain-containing protein n=1 Tax=Natronocella acetinitrilica TaxID=414046 RepID=A0AAE3KC58_9GAMM|nr:high-potential iron-sulfur protein [Natronocella acetinitrilica]MCP1675351.1 hypothetical protein [Natronocella acetinitrilica]